MKTEFEHFQNAGKNIPSSEKEASTEQKKAFRNESRQPEIMLGSAENITFDIFTPNEAGRNLPQKASFVGLKDNYNKGNKKCNPKEYLKLDKSNKETPSQKKYFKFQNGIDSMAGMSFGKNEQPFDENSMIKASSSTRINTLNNTLKDVTNLSKSVLGESLKLNQYKQLSQIENYS